MQNQSTMDVLSARVLLLFVISFTNGLQASETVRTGKCGDTLMSFTQGKEFFAQVSEALVLNGAQPLFGGVYEIERSNTLYLPLLQFLLRELRSLPLQNQVGSSFPLRRDTAAVLNILAQIIEEHLHPGSSATPIPVLIDKLAGWHEVFKSEIYPSHNLSGIGYSVDLWAHVSPQGADLFHVYAFQLERRWIEAHPFSVTSDVFFTFNLYSGELKIEVEKFPTPNVHRGP